MGVSTKPRQQGPPSAGSILAAVLATGLVLVLLFTRPLSGLLYAEHSTRAPHGSNHKSASADGSQCFCEQQRQNDEPLQPKPLSSNSGSGPTQRIGEPVPACETPGAQQQISALQQLVKPRAEQLIEALAATKGGTWLQIGANTMDANLNKNDPIIKLLDKLPTWRKFFVEPIPQLFKALNESVKRWPNSTAINLAVLPDGSMDESVATMYCLAEGFDASRLGKDPDIPYWANQICSFNPGHITKHFPDKASQPVNVTAVSLRELIRRYGMEDVTAVLIDTEGFDYFIVKQLPFDLIRPRLVLWERKHLKGDQQQAADSIMRSHCYAVWPLDAENNGAFAVFV